MSWIKRFYSQEVFDQILYSRDYKSISEFIIKDANLNSSSRVLDQCCGKGLLSVNLKLAKIKEVTAIDLCERNISYLKKTLNFHNLDYQPDQIVCGDATKYRKENYFDIGICWYSSFGHMKDRESNVSFIERIYESLQNNGKIYFEYMNVNKILNNFKTEIQYDNGIKRISSLKGNILHQKWISQGQDPIETAFYLFKPQEIVEIFQNIGFKDIQLFSNISKEKFDSDNSERVIIVASKKQ